VSEKGGKYLLLGITSFGAPCQDLKNREWLDYGNGNGLEITLNGVYTNVAAYVDWIKSNSDYTKCILSKYCYF
jgi:hypothetical protein